MAERKDTDGVVMFPPGVFFAGLVLGFAIAWFWPVPIVPSTLGLAVRVAGIAAFALGFLLMLWALFRFVRLRTTPGHWAPTTALAGNGPYRYSRNPMYVGMTLATGGVALYANALWPLLTLVPVLVIIRTQVIAREEAYLEAKFGPAYTAFKRRVRRWL